MCWMCLQKDYKGIKTAKKDIPIIKIVVTHHKTSSNKTFYTSPIFSFIYFLGRKNPIIKELVPKMDIALYGYANFNKYAHVYSVNRGYHSYNCKNVLFYNDEGVLCIKGIPPCILHYREAVVKGIVPKGSMYLENEYGEIVSNQIILQEEVNLYKYVIMNNNKLTKIIRRIKWKLSYMF